MPADPRAREQRLREDFGRMKQLEAMSGGAISVQATSLPAPDRYVVTYRLKSVFIVNGAPAITPSPVQHEVEFRLPEYYPRTLTRNDVKFLSRPIFHPNVYESGNVCIQDYVAGETLDEFVKRIGRMIQFIPGYANPGNPANGNAAEWYRRNERAFPVDLTRFPERSGENITEFRQGTIVRRSEMSLFRPGSISRR